MSKSPFKPPSGPKQSVEQNVAMRPPTVLPPSRWDEDQNDEIEVLKAVFVEDFELVETRTAWSRAAEKSFKLKLRAYSNPNISVTLVATLTATYPKSVPLLSLENNNNVQPEIQDQIRNIITTKPKELVGEVMIHDIATAIQDVLEDAATVKTVDANLPSLEEERAKREESAAKFAQVKQQEILNRLQEAKAEESRMMRQKVDEELKRQETSRENAKKKKRSEPIGAPMAATVAFPFVSFDQAISYKDDQGNPCSCSGVTVMLKSGSGPVTNVYMAYPPAPQQGSTCFILKRARLGHVRAKQSILDLEEALEKLKTLRHRNIINVLDFRVENDNDEWSFDVLTEIAIKGSLSQMLQLAEVLPVHKARPAIVDLLEGLEFYHKNGVLHNRIHVGNVLVCQSDSGDLVLKLGDAEFQAALYDLLDGVITPQSPMTKEQSSWVVPELGDDSKSSSKRTRKSDIWDFGIVVVEMLFGLGIRSRYSGPTSFINGAGLTSPFEDFVRQSFMVDPKKRPSAFELLPYEFLRTEVAATLSTGFVARRGSHTLGPISMRRESSIAPFVLSRYASEFVEAGRLGKGGYGEVVKARHKMDGQIYAIKKITNKSQAELNKLLSEVYLLATLNHPYVVRYYTAWPEDEPSDNVFSDSDSESGLGSPEVAGVAFAGGLDFISSSKYSGMDFESAPSDEEDADDDDDDEDDDDEDDDDEDDDDEDDDDEDDDDEDDDDEDDDDEDDEDDNDDEKDEDDDAEDGDANSELGNSDNSRTSAKTSKLQSPDHSPIATLEQQSDVLPTMKTTLYIQMEYCEKLTLRDMINQGIQDNVEEVWRILRQVLEGLVHIHNAGIIHRDLKPENIFMDVANSPRIGDFGLATSGQYHLADLASKSAGGDLTRSIGTTLYAAPELKSNVIEQYTDKVDMYSLGIIFFEMCHPVTTGMERVLTLGAIREEHHTLPKEFQSAAKATQGEIIESLIRHDPKERPSSVELLRSGRIPVQIQDETIRLALEGLSDEGSPYYDKMMSALFSQSSKRELKDHMWDMVSVAHQQPKLDYMLLQGIVQEKLMACFRRHGAVQISPPGLIPRSDHYLSSDVVQLISISGTLLQLPYDLTLPHARNLAKHGQVPEKTFMFGTAYRESSSGTAPLSNREVAFAIVSHDTKDLALKEAEVIKVTDEIMDALPPFCSTPMCYHISHSALLEIILDFCRVGISQRVATKETLSKLGIKQWTWQKIRSELRAPHCGLSSTSLDELEHFNFRETSDKCLVKLQNIFSGSEHLNQVKTIFAHVTELVEYLKRLGVRRKVYYSPLSSFNDKFYRGEVMFQCVYDTKKRDVIAAGGRYDRLIEEHRSATTGLPQSPLPHAVGINIAWDGLVASMAEWQKQYSNPASLKKSEELTPSNKSSTRRCDVLVAGFDPTILRSLGTKIVGKLWSHDISAELAVDTSSTEELVNRYREDKHSWIVIIKHEPVATGKPDLKLKSMDKHEDYDIRSSELMSHLRGEIRERDAREGTNGRAKLLRQSSHHAEAPAASEAKGVVQVLMANHKSKKANKWHMVEKAQERAQDLIVSFSDGPIACIEISDDILDRIRETRISDQESWRKVIQNVPLSERQYVHEVCDLLTSFKAQHGETSRYCFVYNFKTGTCIHYDMKL